MDWEALQLGIHHRFSQVKHLRTAMTHSSYANETSGEDNERLEFLGDAVLELIISAEAYRRYPEATEGQMTRIRAGLVKERSLAEIARELGLEPHLLLGRGEEQQGGRDRDSLLSDALEALLGAVFLDAGFDVANTVALRMFSRKWPEEAAVTKRKDYKSQLQELTQKLYKDRPVYVMVGSHGPEHEKTFETQLTLPNGKIFSGEGRSHKRAEQEAARKALEFLSDETI